MCFLLQALLCLPFRAICVSEFCPQHVGKRLNTIDEFSGTMRGLVLLGVLPIPIPLADQHFRAFLYPAECKDEDVHPPLVKYLYKFDVFFLLASIRIVSGPATANGSSNNS